MAARKVKHVGNAAIYIGLPWAKRKSLPRDSRGFEPLAEYFKKTDSDSDSSETDVEELIKEEKDRRKREYAAKKKAALEASRAKKNADLELVAAATKTSDDASETKMEEATKQEEEKRKKEDAAKKKAALETSRPKKKADFELITAATKTSDDDSSETDMEEEKRKIEDLAKKEASRAKKTAELGLVTSGTATSNGIGITNKENEPTSSESGASNTVFPGNTSFTLGVTVDEAAAEAAVVNHGRSSKYSTYSPRQYSLLASPVSKSLSRSKIMPTRLSFSSSDTEGGKGSPRADKRRRRSTRSTAASSLKRTRTHQEAAKVDEGSEVEQEEVEGSSGGQNSASDGSFHPHKTSTQVPRGKQSRPGSSKKVKGVRKISSIQPIFDDSGSESDENDELLKSLMNEGEVPRRFTGLSQLTRSRQPAAAQVSRSKKIEREDRETRKGGNKPPRKSVTFVQETRVASPRKRRSEVNRESIPEQDDSEIGASSESEVEAKRQPPTTTSSRTERSQRRSTKAEKKAPKRVSSVKRSPSPTVEAEAAEVTTDDDAPIPKASTVRKSRKSPVKKLPDVDDTLKANASTTAGKGGAAMKRKSILKEVSVVIQKEPSVSHSQWFVPEDISSMLSKKRTSQSPKKRETTRGSPSKEGGSPRHRRSRAKTATNQSTAVSESRVEASQPDEAVAMDFGDNGESSQSDTGSHGEPRSSPSSADSMRGASAMGTSQADREAGESDTSRKPSHHRKRKRITFANKSKQRKPAARKVSDEEGAVTVRPPGFSSDEEGVTNGLDITRSAGGRRYRRLKAGPKKSHTPGVRRSHRTRLAPVRHWVGEEVEYDEGSLIQGVLVPLGGSVPRPKRRKKVKAEESEDDEEFPTLKVVDRMGNVLEEKSIICSVSKAEPINGQGRPFEAGDEVAIARLQSGSSTSNGLITFQMLGEKERARSNEYDLFFYVIKGQLLFTINAQQFRLKPSMSIHIPSGCVYGIRNLQRTEAQAFFYTHMVASYDTSQASSSEAE